MVGLLLAALSGDTLAQNYGADQIVTRTQCIAAAASRYAVPELLINAVIRTEGGTTGQTSKRNANGTVDLGLMQINEMHLRSAPHRLQSLGITRDVLINNECVNIMVGTYILSVELSKPGEYWWNVGSYNSRTPCERFRGVKPCPNEVYRSRVLANVLRILQGRN
ncbi:lytic transglycosylase domain-containing protein [Xanthomonas perforans]|uniref:lytic transglycosylase domain-containing protein n=1 Tax=Xanthomonas perforans TaxID=442694 RepID=UPI0023598A30|nr:lytic transglycosylase domain-containing protein [Xanthomonas perforans]MDC9654333.1 lytic transglycosylase domain-containing protein [Xanthomonas perforans]MEB2158986.1 lytic transglycosylase domain-containing protein [Xanthomonas campestris pv. campestris]